MTDPDQKDDTDECSVIVSVAQRPLGEGHQNVAERKSEFSIGFRVYKVEGYRNIEITDNMSYLRSLVESQS